MHTLPQKLLAGLVACVLGLYALSFLAGTKNQDDESTKLYRLVDLVESDSLSLNPVNDEKPVVDSSSEQTASRQSVLPNSDQGAKLELPKLDPGIDCSANDFKSRKESRVRRLPASSSRQLELISTRRLPAFPANQDSQAQPKESTKHKLQSHPGSVRLPREDDYWKAASAKPNSLGSHGLDIQNKHVDNVRLNQPSPQEKRGSNIRLTGHNSAEDDYSVLVGSKSSGRAESGSVNNHRYPLHDAPFDLNLNEDTIELNDFQNGGYIEEPQDKQKAQPKIMNRHLVQKDNSEPWWNNSIPIPLRETSRSIQVDLDMLFVLTIAHSGRVQAIAQTPWVSQMQAEQARAAFDPTFYNDTRFNSTSDPVGNTLTTGGPPRLEDNVFGTDTGFRGTAQNGTSYSVGQRLGYKNSNSVFFVPNDQGTSRLFANFTTPLLRGRRTDVNRTLLLSAQFESQIAQMAYQETVQKQLYEVSETYWSLYVERASLLQRQQHLQRATQISNQIANRETHDGVRSQILRAKAAVANRTAELAQVEARIRNLESVLRSLVNAPELVADRDSELLPMQAALIQPIEFRMNEEVEFGLRHRPEIAELHHKANLVNARLDLAHDQTQPTLNLVLEGYVAGLQGNSDIGGAFTDQFSTGRPGYTAGLTYEVPIGRRAANASIRQRQLEMTQLNHLVRETSENVRTEIESAVRNVGAAKQAALSRQVSLRAVAEEVDYLRDRWLTLGNDPRLGQIQLNDLLNGHDRLLQEEQNLLQAMVQYNRALFEVQRATGKLVRFSQ